jgi:hypothetical protein
VRSNAVGVLSQMKTVDAVQAIPVRDGGGFIQGWVRADPFATGLERTDVVFLRDGSACGQADAGKRIALNPALLYATRCEAVQDGLARLRKVAARDS